MRKVVKQEGSALALCQLLMNKISSAIQLVAISLSLSLSFPLLHPNKRARGTAQPPSQPAVRHCPHLELTSLGGESVLQVWFGPIGVIQNLLKSSLYGGTFPLCGTKYGATP